MKTSHFFPIINPTSLRILALVAALNARAATFTDDNWISMGGFPGTDAGVNAVIADGSGNLYISGSFTVVGGVAASRVAKWDGTNWSSLGSGVAGSVWALAVSGSDLYAGGEFTTAGGVAATNIAKWNGTNWSALGSGMNNKVRALVISGNQLYAGGWFTTAGGIAASRIANWNGTSWSALGSGISGSIPGTGTASVNALAVSGSDLYAAGNFESAGGITVNQIAKWDGVNWSALGSGVNYTVNALAAAGGNLYLGGDFSEATNAGDVSVTTSGVAKWDGSMWSALGSGIPATGFAGQSTPYALAVSGSDVYVGGVFTNAGGVLVNHIAKWDGAGWSPLGFGVSGRVSALAVLGSNIFVGGVFTAATNNDQVAITVNSIAKWDGNIWSAFPVGVLGIGKGSVRALAASGSDLYAGGFFPTAGGISANNIAKWNGRTWSALGPGSSGPVDVLAASGNDLYAGGWYPIAKWDGSGWSVLGSGVGFDGHVGTLAVSGTNVYAGGNFTTADGISANSIAKWNGSAWSALGLGVSGEIYSLAVSGSNLFAGGIFSSAGGNSAIKSIARWNGSGWSALGSGVTGGVGVSALAVSGSNVYAGGLFTTAGGISAKNIARWNGSSWSALGSGLDTAPFALAVSGGELYASIQIAGGIANRILRWNGSSWSDLGSGMNFNVVALAALGNDLYAGGDFTVAGGKVSAYLARARISFTPDNLALQVNTPGAQTNTIIYSGVPNFPYVVQYRTNLTGSPWFTLSTNTPAANGVGTVIDPATTDLQRFYRVGYQE